MHVPNKSITFAANLNMKQTPHIFSCFLVALFCALLVVPEAYAESQGDKAERAQGARTAQYNKPIWGKKPNRQTGLYTVRNKNIGNGVCLGVQAMYYYGDIDMLDQAFVHGFQPQNLSVGGSLYFGYLMPLGRFFNWRFALSAGYLHGNDSTRVAVNSKGEEIHPGKGKFSSVFGEFNAGVEFYPLPRAGLYIFAGLGLNMSYINYEFKKFGTGSTVSVVPMLPIEIGYNFYLGGSCFLGLSVGVHQALMDMGRANLDAWPLVSSSVFQWGDGYFQIGLSFSYRWHNCETCRVAKW